MGVVWGAECGVAGTGYHHCHVTCHLSRVRAPPLAVATAVGQIKWSQSFFVFRSSFVVSVRARGCECGMTVTGGLPSSCPGRGSGAPYWQSSFVCEKGRSSYEATDLFGCVVCWTGERLALLCARRCAGKCWTRTARARDDDAGTGNWHLARSFASFPCDTPRHSISPLAA